ncbi:MAG TPA: isoprenoid biosynthesis glyoxalase ElbB [Burkholderiales bacterium]|nr:isoprenoid biosynthesis glyoxalase ElbB [Burkholderiales bacterium]
MKKIAVVLAGCGRMDGSEIHESVLTLLSIEQAGASYQCFSPDLAQDHVTNHLNNETTNETRNMLVESARIARGNVKKLEELNSNDYDALIIPGGNGVAANLFTLAQDGANYTVNLSLSKIAQSFTAAGKAVGFICIAPVMIPAIYNFPVNMTIGSDEGTAALVTKRGAIHHSSTVNEICIDEKYKIVSTAAYMLASNILDAYSGINKLVHKVVELA